MVFDTPESKSSRPGGPKSWCSRYRRGRSQASDRGLGADRPGTAPLSSGRASAQEGDEFRQSWVGDRICHRYLVAVLPVGGGDGVATDVCRTRLRGAHRRRQPEERALLEEPGQRCSVLRGHHAGLENSGGRKTREDGEATFHLEFDAHPEPPSPRSLEPNPIPGSDDRALLLAALPEQPPCRRRGERREPVEAGVGAHPGIPEAIVPDAARFLPREAA